MLLFYLFLALLVSFVCSVLEAVLLSLTPSYIASLPDSKHKERLHYIKEHLDTAISSILILNTIAHTMGAAGVGAEAVQIFGNQWQTVIAIVLTLLILYFSEIIPKTIGASYWRELAPVSAALISFLMWLLQPFLWLSKLLTRGLKSSAVAPSREEIAAMAQISEELGLLEEKEENLIKNLLQLKQIRVSDILTPRSVVFALDATQPIDSALDQQDIFTFSRIPAYIDRGDHIEGVLFSREILKANLSKDDGREPLQTIMKPVFKVSEKIPVFYLMYLFIKRQEHLFIVEDAYNQYMGIVTLEDAIETLLGVEIVDEVDQVVDMQQFAKELSARKDSLKN